MLYVLNNNAEIPPLQKMSILLSKALFVPNDKTKHTIASLRRSMFWSSYQNCKHPWFIHDELRPSPRVVCKHTTNLISFASCSRIMWWGWSAAASLISSWINLHPGLHLRDTEMHPRSDAGCACAYISSFILAQLQWPKPPNFLPLCLSLTDKLALPMLCSPRRPTPPFGRSYRQQVHHIYTSTAGINCISSDMH